MAKIWRKVLHADLRSAVELQERRSAEPANTGEEGHGQRAGEKKSVINMSQHIDRRKTYKGWKKKEGCLTMLEKRKVWYRNIKAACLDSN